MGIVSYRVEQSGPDRYAIRFVAEPETARATAEILPELMRSVYGAGAEVAARSVSSLQAEPSGKFRLARTTFEWNPRSCSRELGRSSPERAAGAHPCRFPLLEREIDGHPIVYLDSASTAPKPRCVIEAVTRVLGSHTANVHRGVHTLADEITAEYEAARLAVATF